MGPLAQLWKILKYSKQTEGEIAKFKVEQIVVLLGQSSNAITYHRR